MAQYFEISGQEPQRTVRCCPRTLPSWSLLLGYLLLTACLLGACSNRSFTNPVDPGQDSGGAVVRRFPAPTDSPTGLLWKDNFLWVADETRQIIFRVDPLDGRTDKGLEVEPSPLAGLGMDGRTLVAVNPQSALLFRIDPLDGRTSDARPLPGTSPWGIAIDGDIGWISDLGSGQIISVSWPNLDVIAAIPAPGPKPAGLALANGVIYVADAALQRIFMLDRYNLKQIGHFPSPGSEPLGLVLGDGLLWCSDGAGQLFAIEAPDETAGSARVVIPVLPPERRPRLPTDVVRDRDEMCHRP